MNSLLNFFSIQFNKLGDFGTKNISIVIYVLIAILSLDTVLNQLSDLIGEPLKTAGGIALFFIVASITIICQLFVLHFVRKKSNDIRKNSRGIRLMHKCVSIIQYFIIVIFIFLVFDITLKQHYSPISSMLVTFLSYMESIILMGIFTVIFLSWYMNNRESVLVLVYGLSFATVVIASVAILTVLMYQFSDKLFNTILPSSLGNFIYTEQGSIWKLFAKIYQYSDIVSFFLKWGGTALILYHYSHKIGQAKYWFLLSLPLLYFSTIIIYHFHIYEPHEEFEKLIFYGIVALNSTFGGILFYLAFKLTGKNFKSNEFFGNYLIIAGFGFMLFFSGSQSILTNTAYPPFGFATVSSYGLGSYLILIGLYLSAIFISMDTQLKNMVKNSTLAESRFLNSIGTSAAEREKTSKNDKSFKTKHQEKTDEDHNMTETSGKYDEKDGNDHKKGIDNKDIP